MIGSAAVRVEQRLVVRVGEARVAKPGAVLVALGLGSCVAVVLYDPGRRVAGLAHVLLPDPSAARHPGAPGRFATTAVPHLIQLMEAEGAARERLYARLVGGANMFPQLLATSGATLGMRNIVAARAALKAAGIPLRGEDVGGEHGRSVFVTPADGRILVTSVQQPDVSL
ncbi:MAG TPA: chemotaxis protein CheD [Longimicrobiales bacterium]